MRVQLASRHALHHPAADRSLTPTAQPRVAGTVLRMSLTQLNSPLVGRSGLLGHDSKRWNNPEKVSDMPRAALDGVDDDRSHGHLTRQLKPESLRRATSLHCEMPPQARVSKPVPGCPYCGVLRVSLDGIHPGQSKLRYGCAATLAGSPPGTRNRHKISKIKLVCPMIPTERATQPSRAQVNGCNTSGGGPPSVRHVNNVWTMAADRLV